MFTCLMETLTPYFSYFLLQVSGKYYLDLWCFKGILFVNFVFAEANVNYEIYINAVSSAAKCKLTQLNPNAVKLHIKCVYAIRSFP